MTRIRASGAVSAAMAVLCLGIGMGMAGRSAAQDAYPSKPIKVILPFPAGSSTDSMFRPIMDQLRERLGQPIIVEPRPGAGAVAATLYVMSQPADGYTLMVSTSSQTITSAKANPPFDVRKMTHIIRAVGGPVYIFVNTANIKATTLREFIDYARANPGKINFGSYGPGTLGHLAIELFNRVAKVDTVHVPYNGSPNDALALANGTSDAAIDVMTFMAPQMQTGKIRALAATSQERSAQVPEVPGMREAGLPNFDVTFWQGFAGPGGLPPAIVNKLNEVINAALKSPPVIDYTAKLKNNLYGGSQQEMVDIVNREVDTWTKLIKDAHLTID